MKILCTVVLSLFFVSSHAQKEIKLEELQSHIGDSVKIKGEVFGVRYLPTTKNSPTLINIGAAYPNQLLTVVIWEDVRKKLPYKPEEVLQKGSITVIGKVELYKEKPQIVIHKADQLVFKYDEEVPADQIPPIDKKDN